MADVTTTLTDGTPPASTGEGTTDSAGLPSGDATTAAATTTPAEGATTPDGSTSEHSWLDSLPEDLKGSEKIAGFKSIADLAKAYNDAKLAPVVPEATAYTLPEGFPIKDIGVWANKVGLSQEQLDNMLALQSHVITAEQKHLDTTYKQGLDALFTEWGPEKDSNIANAKKLIEHFDTTGELKQLLNETKAGNHPTVVRFMAALGKAAMAEDGFIRSKGTQTQSTKSAADTIFDGK